MSRGAWTPTFSLGTAGHRSEARKKRFLTPHENDLVFGFLLRFCSGIAATLAAAVPVLLIAWTIDWKTPPSLLFFYGFQVFVFVLIGEHFRSRIFERILKQDPSITRGDEFQSKGYPNTPGPRLVSVRTVLVSRIVKRITDIVVSAFALWLLFPVLTIVAVIVKLDSHGPILVRRRFHNVDTSFIAFTFRTGFPTTKQVRGQTYTFTRAGRFLRLSSLDELPLLFSVLKGDMSLIGPPARIFTQKQFLRAIHKSSSNAKALIKPGLISYTYAISEKILGAERVAEIELAYASRWSLVRDLRTILMGAYRVIVGTSPV